MNICNISKKKNEKMKIKRFNEDKFNPQEISNEFDGNDFDQIVGNILIEYTGEYNLDRIKRGVSAAFEEYFWDYIRYAHSEFEAENIKITFQ